MKLKRYLWIAVCLIALAVSVLPAYSQQFLQPHTGFQVSTFAALKVGVYEGAATLAELKPHGDFGLGTLEGLDGEMVIGSISLLLKYTALPSEVGAFRILSQIYSGSRLSTIQLDCVSVSASGRCVANLSAKQQI